MRHFSLFILASFALTANLFAQSSENHTLTSKVLDENGNGIPFANVVIYDQSDSSLVKGAATDVSGEFNIQLQNGTYYLQISFLSYQRKQESNIKIEGRDLKINPVKLQPNTKLLEEVEVVEERNQMELKLDKRVFNIVKNLSNAGANVAEILDNLPSVQVDIEGNVSLRGSQNVRVLIDGKPSSITGSSTSDVLRQFQGNMIERVEVITNPSARYDAEGEVGIINIVLKKEKQRGLNGSVEAVAGYPDNYRASFNLNYRSKKTNFFTSYGGAYRKSPGGGESFQTFDNGDTSYVYRSNSERERGGLSQNFRLGADYFIDDKNTITVAGLYRYSDELNISTYEYRDLFANSELYRLVVREDEEEEIGENLEGSINYTRKYTDEDQKLTFDFQWSESDDLEESDIEENNSLSQELLEQRTSNREANRTILIQSDYTHPVNENGLFETGFRTTLRTVQNEYFVKQRTATDDPFLILDEFNNDFLYEENIYAAYVMFGNEIKRFSYQVGLRGELSDISTLLKLTDESNSWNYFNFFPSAHLTYELKNKDNFQLSYSRRINRPRYRYLMPFQTFSDARNLWRGNPDVQPEYTDSYELGYLKYFPKGSLFSALYYRYRTGVIERITVADEEGFTQRLPVNLATENNIGFEFNASYDFSKKFNMNASMNVYRAISEGSYQGTELKNDVITMNSRLMAKMEILPKVDMQFSGRYEAPQETTQGRRKSLYTFDLSLSKEVMNGKGTLVASVRDLLNSRIRRSIVDTDVLYSESEFQWRARQFLVSFTYRINQKKSRGAKGGEGGEDDF